MHSDKVPVELPDLGDVESVVVVGWMRREGDAVTEGEDLVEVETEKTTFVIPAPASGCLSAIHAVEGRHVVTGEALGTLERRD